MQRLANDIRNLIAIEERRGLTMKHQGRGVIRLNDKTDHGGQVTTASSGSTVMGVAAALQGDMTQCHKCKGNFAIKLDGAGARHEGTPYAYDGDVTECG